MVLKLCKFSSLFVFIAYDLVLGVVGIRAIGKGSWVCFGCLYIYIYIFIYLYKAKEKNTQEGGELSFSKTFSTQ